MTAEELDFHALLVRHDEMMELLSKGDVKDPHKALWTVIAPSEELLKASLDKAKMLPFVQPGSVCPKGHLRTTLNTRWKRKNIQCRICENEREREWEARNREKVRRRKRESYHKMMKDPEKRARKNAQNRAAYARIHGNPAA